MPLKHIAKKHEKELESIEKELSVGVVGKDGLLGQVSGHIMESGGKRIRPLILIIASKLCGYNGYYTTVLGSVVELIHTATLLHDDVVDGADMRRGRKAARTIWGNRASILVGDYIFITAIRKAFDLGNKEINDIVIRTCNRLVDGEIIQLMHNGDLELSDETYFKILQNKTAEVFGVACRLGGVVGGVSEEKKDALEKFGVSVGIAFQVADDALDYVSDKVALGKSMGRDLEEGKLTLPLLHLIKKCDNKEKQEIEKIIQSGDFSSEKLEFIQNLMVEYGSIEYSMEIARNYVSTAIKHLEVFEECDELKSMVELAEFFIARKY